MDKQLGPTYSTGNYIQSLGIEHDGRQYKKNNAYIYIHTYIHMCVCVTVQQKLAQHCKSTIIKKQFKKRKHVF